MALSSDKRELFRRIIEEGIPFNKLIGLKLETAQDGKARGRFHFQETLVGNPVTRALHGGVIASALDVIGACAVMTTFAEEDPLWGMGTVDMRVDYLRPGAGTHFVATGEVMRPGRILAATRMELRNDQGELVAMGTAIYRVSRKAQQAPPNL